jgi:hypothetical protein
MGHLWRRPFARSAIAQLESYICETGQLTISAASKMPLKSSNRDVVALATWGAIAIGPWPVL